MAYFELTEEKLEVKGTTVYRIRATENIEGALVKKGEFGGYACKKSTLTGKSWVSGDAIVIASHLTGDVKIMGYAVVESCRLSGDCHIQNNALLVKVDGGNIFAAGDCIIENTQMVGNSLGKFGYLIQDKAVIRSSKLQYTGKETGKVIKISGTSTVTESGIIGTNIQILKHSNLKSVRINAVDSLLENVKEMKMAKIEGADIQLIGVTKFNDSQVDGLDVQLKGMVEVKQSRIKASYSKFSGMDVQIADSHIEGEHIEISDYAEIAFVDIMGDRVEIANQATLVGLTHDRILVGSNSKIQDCASFLIDEDGSSPNLSNTVIAGDFEYTGR